MRSLSSIDRFINGVDTALRTLSGNAGPGLRSSPGQDHQEPQLNEQQRVHVAGLMRVNHTGEVCAQALYQGQASTAKQPKVAKQMQQAAQEEVDHLVWCEQRLEELNSQPALLNPLWYGMSYSIGAAAGVIGDKTSLGFVAATEEKVCEHLNQHLQQLPDNDDKTRAVLAQMAEDEARHGDTAMAAGGEALPVPVKSLMAMVAKVMTTSSYKF